LLLESAKRWRALEAHAARVRAERAAAKAQHNSPYIDFFLLFMNLLKLVLL
jgi:hypothetical protein